MTQKKWQSPVVWGTIVALVALLMGNYGLWAVIGMDEGTFRGVCELVIAIFIGFGIFNNPDDPNNF
jgi:hypothetical protein